jgi:hypothetical protein
MDQTAAAHQPAVMECVLRQLVGTARHSTINLYHAMIYHTTKRAVP